MLNKALSWPPANPAQVLMLGRMIDCLRHMGLKYHDCRKVVGAILNVEIAEGDWEDQMQEVDHHESQVWRVKLMATVTSPTDPSTWSHDAIMEELVNYNTTVEISAVRLVPSWERDT